MSFVRILVATDFSDTSSQALWYAVALAQQYRARIFLAHVLTAVDEFGRADTSSTIYRTQRHEAERSIAEILASGQMQGISHEVLLEEGFLCQTLDRLIRGKQVDLVAAGTRGAGSLRRESVESPAEFISRHADCPVLMAGPAIEGKSGQARGFQNILFATDFGLAAAHAAPCAFSLARELRVAVTLVHVLGETSYYSENGLAMLEETTRVRLIECVPEGLEQSCKVECAVHYGDPAKQIVRAAQEKNADLIVMGARAGRPLAAHLPQAVSYTVAINAPCPLITVRA
jgi:nucleotide-binding universal stress UspA family protein